MTNKPREFWISLGEECDDIVWRTHPKNEHFNFHVVEYSAYQALLEQVERMVRCLEQINREELNSQRPGGHYSKSATLSYEALQKWQEFKK